MDFWLPTLFGQIIGNSAEGQITKQSALLQGDEGHHSLLEHISITTS